MAGAKVRGITIDLGVDTSGFASGLKQANSAINSTAKELKDIDKLLKLDPSNTTLLAQKQEALQRAVSQTSDKLKLLKEAEEKLSAEMKDGGTEEQQRQLAALQREIISTENNLEKYTNQLNSAESETRQLAQAEEQAGNATGQMKEGFTVLKGALANLVAQGISKAVEGFKDMMTYAPQFADQILTLSSKTGIATDRLQELSYMSGLVDVDVSTVAGSMKKLTKNMDSARDGTGSAAEAFKTLGVSVTDINGSLRDNEDVFFDAIDALGQIENETERDAIAMSLFGKSATDLNPMIEAGSDALRGFAQEAHDMGYVLDGDALDSLAKVQDEFDRFGKQMESVKIQIASGVAPAIERGMKKLSDVVKKIDWKKIGDQMGKAFDKLVDGLDWIVQHGELVKSLLTGIVTALAVNKVMSFVSTIKSMVTALKAATVAQEGMNAAANSNPYVLLATALIALTAAAVSYGKSISEARWESSALGQEINALQSEMEEMTEATENAVQKYQDIASARSESIAATEAETAHIQSLTDELDTLIDSNGQVSDADKARADFIVNELNGALGTEYDLTDLLNGKYQEMKDSIYQLIDAKRAEAILATQEQAYSEAISGLSDAEALLAQNVQERINKENEVAQLETEIQELQSKSREEMTAKDEEMLENKRILKDELLSEIDTLEGSYQGLADTVDQYVYDINQYESNWVAAHDQNWGAIDTKSWEVAKSMGEAGSAYSTAVATSAYSASKSWMTALGQQLSEATGKKVEFKDAGEGMVQAYVDGQKYGEEKPATQVKAMAEKIHTNMVALTKDMGTSGYNAVAGFANSVDMYSFMATNAGRNLANEFLAAFRARMDEGSPSREMAKSGLNAVLGFTNEVKSDYKMVEGVGVGMADAFLNPFNMQMNSMLSGNAGTSSMSSAGSSSTVYGGTNNITLNVYGTEGQSVNDLADAVIDQLQRTIQGSEAVYA